MTLIKLLLVLCLLGVGVIAQDASQATLIETTDWIRTTLNSHGNCIERQGHTTDSERTENIRFDDCTMMGTYILESAYDSRVLVSAAQDATFRLSDIDRIVVTRKNGHWVVNIYTKGKNIKGEMRMGLPGQHTRQPLAASEFQLPCDDEQIAERVKTALLHAVDLCKKQKEPF